MSEDDIEKKAVEELLQEAKRARERAKEHGTFGWNKPKIAAVNKRFLKNTLVSTMRGQMTHRDFKNFDKEDGPAVVDRPGLKRKDSSPEKTDGKKKTKEENSKSTDPKEEKHGSELTQPDKTRREKVYNTFDYIRLNESFKRSYLKEKDSEEKDPEEKDSESSKSKETSDEPEVKDTTNSERPKIELKFKKLMR